MKKIDVEIIGDGEIPYKNFDDFHKRLRDLEIELNEFFVEKIARRVEILITVLTLVIHEMRTRIEEMQEAGLDVTEPRQIQMYQDVLNIIQSVLNQEMGIMYNILALDLPPKGKMQ